MNKRLHRVVFNTARGLRVVVQETARAAGKASGATALVSSAVLMAAWPVRAQVVGAPGVAPNLRPTVLVAPNGVPLVNIQTPSAAGVSRNLYNQFDVQARGVILNNSRTDVQTQLGGWVQGNPFLATGPARIILNEIVSGNPTQLRGAIEVGGQRAEVIVANPAGIAVDGGGFINASRATLTTGTPQLNAFGGLDGYVVRGGTVSIDGAGLDARSTDYAAILARAVQVNAGIWANELKVVTGANQVSADHVQATPTTGAGTVPVFALDVSHLGGMYAGKITLIGTEAGLGVRNAGAIGAAAGELVVTAAGRLENRGTLEAQSLQIAAAGDIDSRSSSTLLGGSASVAGLSTDSGGDLTLRGAVVDGNRVTADVGGDLNIETLQDVSVGASRQSSSGLNVSLCIPPICYGAVATVGGSAAGAKANGVFISPNTQAGIQAGDGGFDVNVRGNTNLTGAVIESTQGAIDAGKNSFQTGGTLTMSDLQNVSSSSGSSYAVNGGIGIGHTTAPVAATDTAAGRDMTVSLAGPNNRPSGSAGGGSYSGDDQNSATRSGISGIAGDQSVRTGNNASAGTLIKDWNTQAIVRDVQAQSQITAEFGRNASVQVGSYANGKLKEAAALYDQAAAESDPERKAALYAQADEIERNWREGGPYRIAAHAAVSGLAGGANGAAGAAASGLAVPIIGERIAELDIPVPVKEALIMATGAAIGAVTGGTSGAASAFNETTNNYLSAAELRSRDQKIKRCQASGDTDCEVRVLREYELESARNTGQLSRSSLIERVVLERTRTELEQLLLDPSVSEETKGQARISIREINTAINVISKAPVLKDAAEWGLLAVDVATLGEFAVARTLTNSVLKQIVFKRTGKELSEDVATRITNNFYRDGIDASAWTVGKTGSMENNAITHWTKHGAEFPEYPSFAQYTEAAQNFVVNPPLGAQTFTRANGERLIYPLRNIFAVSTADGVPKTMFRPTNGIDYWLKQIK